MEEWAQRIKDEDEGKGRYVLGPLAPGGYVRRKIWVPDETAD
jgi:hypothetical protein